MATHSLKKKRLPLLGRRRKVAAIVVAAAPVLALAAVVLPSATPAYAYSCPLNDLCTWQNSNYSGTQWNFGIGSEGYWWYVGNNQNDQISSIYNHTGGWKAWVDKDCPAGGQYTWVGNGSKAPNLANNKWPNGTSMNDSISAYGIDDSLPAHGSRPAGGC